MKIVIQCLLLVLMTFQLSAQVALPEFQITEQEVQSQIEYLASDALMGRRTGTPGNDTAAYFLAWQMASFGVKPVPGKTDYFQKIRFDLTKPPTKASLAIDGKELKFKDEFILLTGKALDTKAEVVYANYGWIDEDTGHNDYEGLDVKGKIVISLPGIPDSKDPYAPFKAIRKKRQMAKEQGATALLELYQISFPWPMFKSNFAKERLSLGDASEMPNDLPYGFINATMGDIVEKLKAGTTVNAQFSSGGQIVNYSYSNNVIGYVEGTDSKLKEEFVLVSAHYDHVGAGKAAGGNYSEQDSIFNGARDNAIGVAALLSTAKAIAAKPTARSVIFLAVTAEEIGLLGSEYYAENPLIPLNKTIFNLNTDGAGYDDTGAVSVIGYGRTGTDQWIEQSAKSQGLKVIQNPAPEAQLFDRSDNVSFSQRGVPSATYSPGVTAFTPQIMANYHQVSDEADDLDFSYVLKYCKAFANCARLIGNSTQSPQWVKGDKYEAVGNELYGDK